jgi:Short C-terminal domain
MTFGAVDEGRVDGRAVAGLLVATAGLAGCVTLLFLGMRAVMDIGGACAEGGPFVPVQPCPEGVALVMPLAILGLFGFGALGFWAGARLGGAWAGLPLLAWPALFLSLGWNFLEYGISPPEDLAPEGGLIWGWLLPGVVFIAMGAVPVWIAWRARDEIRTEGNPAVARRFGMPGIAESTVPKPPSPSPAGDPSHRPDGPDGSPEDVVGRLERLAALRRRGDITNAEYEAAKAQLLGGGPDPGDAS